MCTPQHTLLMPTLPHTQLIHMTHQNIVRFPKHITLVPTPLKMEIPVPRGEPLDWQPFWDCFAAAIDTNPTLTGVQKLSYLRAQLQGEATRVITGLRLTHTNYQTSVTLLKECYGEPQQIISAHVQALLDQTVQQVG